MTDILQWHHDWHNIIRYLQWEILHSVYHNIDVFLDDIKTRLTVTYVFSFQNIYFIEHPLEHGYVCRTAIRVVNLCQYKSTLVIFFTDIELFIVNLFLIS